MKTEQPTETTASLAEAEINASFVAFCHVAAQVSATPKRLEKAALLGAYFAPLSDDDLRIAARFFAGSVFPLSDQRTLNVGQSALMNALLEVSQVDETLLRTRLVQLGDVGDLAAEVLPPSSTRSLALQELEAAFAALAQTSGTKKKTEAVIALLRQLLPLEAKFAVKLMSGEWRIGIKESAVEDALARLAQVAVAQVQWTNMLTGDIGQTAILARHDQLESARLQLFAPLKFMLASPAADIEEVARQMPDSFVVEDKYDGIRAQAHIAPNKIEYSNAHGEVVPNAVSNALDANRKTVIKGEVDLGEALTLDESVSQHESDQDNSDQDNSDQVEDKAIGDKRVALFSRTLDEITRSFPDLLQPLAKLLVNSDGLILDGEIVPIDSESGTILPFQELQKRLGRKTLTPEVLAQIPVAFIIYDVLYGENKVLMDEPFSVRRAVLDKLPTDEKITRRAPSQSFSDAKLLDDEFDAARARGNEGLMVKDPRASYKPGKRGREWLKIKRALATLDVVVTSVEVGSGRRSKFLSDFTFAVRTSETDSTLLNVGKAYSGLTDAEIGELSEWFKAHTIQEFAHGKVRVVEPNIVLEITFDRVQPSPRHKSGFALRFPRILRWRTDKPVEEIDTLETVRKLAE